MKLKIKNLWYGKISNGKQIESSRVNLVMRFSAYKIRRLAYFRLVLEFCSWRVI